jgi:large subunit ribosomal protein L35
MPKMKTRKSAASRYKVTGSGKVKYKKQGLRHILTKKSSKRKRKLRKSGTLSAAEVKKIKKLLPYNF